MCRETAMHINLSGKKFKGKPLRCRMKTNTIRFPMNPSAPLGQERGIWKSGQVPQHVPPNLFYPKPTGYPPFNPFPPMVGPHTDPSGHHRKSKRGKQKNAVYHPKQKQGVQGSQDTDPSKKVYIKYQQPCLKYNREQMAEIVRKYTKEGFTKPRNLSRVGVSPVIADKAAADSQLLEPMPVMYPASPSPLFAAQPHHSSMPPFLDLGVPSNPGRGSMSANRDEKTKKGRSKKSSPKKYAKKPSKPKQRKGRKMKGPNTAKSTKSTKSTKTATSLAPSKPV